MAEILFDKKDGIARITFNRPEVRNAITVDMFRKFGQVIDEAIQDHDIRILILSGSGQSFSVGADIKEANEMIRKSYQDKTPVSSIREIVVLEQKGVYASDYVKNCL